MKKKMALVIAGAALIAACMTGCGNKSYGFGNYTYSHIHFSDQISGHCATVEKWYESESGIEVKTKECGSLFLSEGTYIMLEGAEKCPFCH